MYNPAQQAVIDLLGKSADRPDVDASIGSRLLDDLIDGITPYVDGLIPDDPVWVSKHALAGIHSCEAQYLAGQGDFEWSVANVRGIVAHRGIELTINMRTEAAPMELVDEALARLINDDRAAGQFIGGLSEFDLADLRSTAVDKVSAFQESFPALKPQWVPRTESRSRVDLFDGRVVLQGKTDLTLGRPGDKVIIDLKTGSVAPVHREDLRFYAMLETIKLGRPPRKLASYYLDTARAHAEDVSEAVLDVAVRRTVDGVRRLIAITRAGDTPTVQAGPQCRWCPLFESCEEGQAEQRRRQEFD
jgi:CRISPR/Cas system-associated exonuclease Cas4 (RecB family)